jgi:hypothetical protein
VTPDVQDFLLGTVSGLTISAVFLLVVFIGFCIVVGFSKLRQTGKTSMVHRSLDEMVGQDRYAKYLPPTAPRGPADQLRTPELIEAGIGPRAS